VSTSKLVRMRIANFGCIGPEGIEVLLDNIVCLVGPNNAGKSTVLRAYEAAVTSADLKPDLVHASNEAHPPSVELWVHIPAGTENIDEKWKEPEGELLVVRSKWEWPASGGKPRRWTWDPERREYAEDGRAAGLDTVFNSRLPKPFRIGALEDPAKEHAKLLELVLEPVSSRLKSLMLDEDSEIRAQVKALQAAAERPVDEFREQLLQVQQQVNASYASVFSTAQVRLDVALGDLAIDPASALVKSSAISIIEPHGQTRWSQQGTGSQRALFWSMLEVRSELNRLSDLRRQTEKSIKDKDKDLRKFTEKLPTLKKEDARLKCEADIRKTEEELRVLRAPAEGGQNPQPDAFLPGYMLLIEEPETALHPSAVRAAKNHLYSLAAGSGWQVMLTTHHPVFVDPLEDHTTIVRLDRPEAHQPPHVYRADEMRFTEPDRENLKSLLAFDTGVAEMFFGPKVVIVEGDTECAAFAAVMEQVPDQFPAADRPLILRARGKAMIPILIRMLTHFKVDFTVLHDVDAPRTVGGARVNGMHTFNSTICAAVAEAQAAGLRVNHSCSCPDFELHHSIETSGKDKPFEAWRAVRTDEPIRTSVGTVFGQLLARNGNEPATQCFKIRIREWARVNAPTDPAYTFED